MSEKRFLIGTYAPAGDPSIFEAALDAQHGALAVRPVSAEAENPSWLTLHPNGRVLYAVEERVPNGGLAVFVREDGDWQLKQRFQAGSAPCHIALDDRAAFLFVSNYMDGTLDAFALEESGMVLRRTDHIRHSGHGPNAARQEGPHIHSALYRDGLLYSADLGLDKVFAYRLNRKDGTLEEDHTIDFPAGSGPRHMAVHPAHPGMLYVNSELGGSVFAVDLNKRSVVQQLSVIPADYTADFRVSSIKFAGDTLYVGSRECNVVVMFPLKADGTLGGPAVYRHRQETPRDVWMNDAWCITADEGSNGLTLLRRDGAQLQECCRVSTGTAKPTCVMEE